MSPQTGQPDLARNEARSCPAPTSRRCAARPSDSQVQASSGSRKDAAILLVHGLASAPLILAPLARELRTLGYANVVNWSYPSVTRTIASHRDRLRAKLEEMASDSAIRQVHLVTHSMGGILARHALADQPRLDGLGRIVMLCPPNGGSRVAANIAKVAGWLCTPLGQLSDEPESFVNSLPNDLPYEVGIVAARRDRVVAVDRTVLPNQADMRNDLREECL